MPWLVLFVGLALLAFSPFHRLLRIAAGIAFVIGAVLAAVGMG